MKGLFSLLLLLGVWCVAAPRAQAQHLPPRRTAQPKPRTKPTTTMLKDGFLMKDGKVNYTQNGTTNLVLADVKTVSGTTVSPTGLVTRPDGSTTQLVEGDYTSLTGRVTTKREMMDADSVRKAMDFDIHHPGKRKEMEAAREKAEKAKAKLDKEKAKMKEKSK